MNRILLLSAAVALAALAASPALADRGPYSHIPYAGYNPAAFDLTTTGSVDAPADARGPFGHIPYAGYNPNAVDMTTTGSVATQADKRGPYSHIPYAGYSGRDLVE